MRISERKRQLREQAVSGPREDLGASETTPKAARVARARPAPAKSAPRASSKSGARAPQPRARPARKQRGPRFYAGFGVIGLLFSLTLIWTTFSSYNTNKNAYPAAQATYTAQTRAYPTAVAKYNEAKAQHVKPLPKAPVAPKAPTRPVLSLGSFALPILYVALSLAYLYLAYRAAQQRKLTDGAATPAAQQRKATDSAAAPAARR